MIRPEDIGNYLILKYKRTVFQCDKRKLQKITIYSDLVYYAIYNERMLEEDIVTASPSGLSINRLSTGIYDLILNSYNSDQDIEESDISKSDVSLNTAYAYNDNALNCQQKECIDYVFKKLGAYSGDNLTLMSKRTELWEKARELATSEQPNPNVTCEMYNNFIKVIGVDICTSNDQKQEKIVLYLKNKLQEELEKHGKLSDFFTS